MITQKYLILVGIVLVIIGGTLLYQEYSLSNKQVMVHEMGSRVMPFSLEKTTHVFKQLPDGGIEQVFVKDLTNTEQIDLVQAHLKYEVDNFRQGNFEDPMTIHGDNMPGVSDLRKGAAKITFTYHALPNGAEIVYSSKDPDLISAIHVWFDAQVKDHGRNAMEMR